MSCFSLKVETLIILLPTQTAKYGIYLGIFYDVSYGSLTKSVVLPSRYIMVPSYLTVLMGFSARLLNMVFGSSQRLENL